MQIDHDHSLLAAARLGDEHAYGRLVERHRAGLELYCELMVGCREQAHQAVQEVLLRGWSELDRVEPAASARIWLYRLATGVCLEDPDRTNRATVTNRTDHLAITDRTDHAAITDPTGQPPISFDARDRWTT